ncbi:dTDP-4-dehydrorhamnose reductase [Flavobacteriaceae bacterium]|nr:dTDP-4-dehydrorhamnose reductase [Flavobacteriaceae bacterium]MDB2340479.1 dTDP-4-dehydrorhamnose reductase [Flavobacteriaceae bacterium]
MPSYLVTGGSGQLGQCFQAVAKEFPEINLLFTSRNEVDITRSETLANFHSKKPFDGIINCAAYTNVDQAEKEQESALKINTEGLQNLIAFAEEKKLSIIHFSTDYVFDGNSSEPYREEAETNPLGVYGASKLQGEIHLSKSSCENVSIRTSWLFSPFGKNFVKTIAHLAKEKKELKVVEDQCGRPTYGIDLARAVLSLISNKTIYRFPILHYANKGICSWKEFAEAIVNTSGSETKVLGVSTSDYPTLAKRPKYSILDTERIERVLKIEIPLWNESLKKCLQIIKSNESL